MIYQDNREESKENNTNRRSKLMMEFYKSDPITIVDGVPVFVEDDFYSANYDEIADTLLSNIVRGGGNPWMEETLWREAEEDTVKICKRYLKQGDKILDVGVGLGRLLSYFKNVDKFGIDISVGMAKESRKKGIEACKGNVEKLPYVDNLFDMVVCTDVLEHVFDLNKTVSEIKRVLKPNGYLIVRVPWEEDMRGYLASSYPYEYVHLRMFSRSSLQLFFTKVFGFKMLTYKYTYFILRNTVKMPVREFEKSTKLYFKVLLLNIKRRLHIKKGVISGLNRPVEVIMAFREE